MIFRGLFEKKQGRAVNTHKNTQRWLETFRSVSPDLGAKIDSNLILKYARPTFFREELNPMTGRFAR